MNIDIDLHVKKKKVKVKIKYIDFLPPYWFARYPLLVLCQIERTLFLNNFAQISKTIPNLPGNRDKEIPSKFLDLGDTENVRIQWRVLL